MTCTLERAEKNRINEIGDVAEGLTIIAKAVLIDKWDNDKTRKDAVEHLNTTCEIIGLMGQGEMEQAMKLKNILVDELTSHGKKRND
jgi:hypothetical protein